jgi:hypothetical protein
MDEVFEVFVELYGHPETERRLYVSGEKALDWVSIQYGRLIQQAIYQNHLIDLHMVCRKVMVFK